MLIVIRCPAKKAKGFRGQCWPRLGSGPDGFKGDALRWFCVCFDHQPGSRLTSEGDRYTLAWLQCNVIWHQIIEQPPDRAVQCYTRSSGHMWLHGDEGVTVSAYPFKELKTGVSRVGRG